MPEKVTVDELVNRYVARQDATVEGTKERMEQVRGSYDVAGWMLLECHQLDSSRLGDYVILPYGPTCTFKEPPTRPISPRGLASDMSVVVMVAELPVPAGHES